MEEKKTARVIASYRGKYKVLTDSESHVTEVTGNFANKCMYISDFPVVGDYVVLNDFNYIIEVVTRKNLLVRQAAGGKHQMQAIASNVDCMFITTSLNIEFNPVKLERFILLAQVNQITPVVVFTKADLCENVEEWTKEIMKAYENVAYIITSSYEKKGMADILAILQTGKTGVFVGASGVGKSTLVNSLLKKEVMKTGSIREYDAQGRHTTTHKELFELENGAYIIDTPGIREINLWIDDDTYVGFSDIEELARGCKFSNCKHDKEEDCNVKRAVASGELSQERYRNYIKYSRQVYYASLGNNVAERTRFKNKVKVQSKNERYNR